MTDPKIGERLKQIAEFDQVFAEDDVQFLLHHLNELRRLAQNHLDFWEKDGKSTEFELRRYLEELNGND